MSVCEYHMRLFLMDCRLALACMQHAADGESKQSITASPLVVSSLLSSLPLPSVSHEHLHFKNSLIKMNVSFSSLAGGYKDAPWIRQDRSALNLQVLKRKKTVIEPQLVCNFCKWALWQPKSKWVYYIMQSNSKNIGNHYRPVTRFIQSTNFPFNISCPVLLTRFKVSWYSWPSPLSVSYIQEGWSHQWPCTCLACPGGAILHESLGSFCCRQSLQMYWSKTPHLARWWGWTGGQPPFKGVQPQASRGTEHERFWALFLQWKLRIIKVIPESISFCKISWVTGDRCRTATSNCFFPSNTFEVSGHVLCSVFIYPSSSQQSSFQ